MSENQEENISACNYIVAFIDILGQKENLEKFPKLILDDIDMQSLEESIRETYAKKYKICNLANKWFKDNRYLQNNVHEIILSGKREGVNIEYWGDAIVVYSKLAPSPRDIDLREVYNIISGCACFMLIMLSENIAIRGGVEIGVALDKLDFGIYGSALYGAYELAEHIAGYPRIVVGEELIKFLSSRSSENYLDKINQGLAKKCLDLICEDEGDGRKIIDFLNCAPIENPNSQNFKNVISKGSKFVNSEFEKFKKDKNSKLAFRYALLKDYYLTRLNDLGITIK